MATRKPSLEEDIRLGSGPDPRTQELAAALVADVVGMGAQMSEGDFVEVPVDYQGFPIYPPRVGTEAQGRELDSSIWTELLKQLEKNKETEETPTGKSRVRG